MPSQELGNKSSSFFIVKNFGIDQAYPRTFKRKSPERRFFLDFFYKDCKLIKGESVMVEKQANQEPLNFYLEKEMGKVLGSKTMALKQSFLRDVLLPQTERKDEVTKVGCPFCKEGSLKLESKKPKYSGSPRPTPTTLHHVGNDYEFSCTNLSCSGKFLGTNTWMYID